MTDREDYLLKALLKIAAHPGGGRIVPGTPAGDRDEMIHEARHALRKHYGLISYAAVLARLEQENR